MASARGRYSIHDVAYCCGINLIIWEVKIFGVIEVLKRFLRAYGTLPRRNSLSIQICSMYVMFYVWNISDEKQRIYIVAVFLVCRIGFMYNIVYIHIHGMYGTLEMRNSVFRVCPKWPGCSEKECAERMHYSSIITLNNIMQQSGGKQMFKNNNTDTK